MKILVGAIAAVLVFTACGGTQPIDQGQQEDRDTLLVDVKPPFDMAVILGVWTDGSGPNASFMIERDSIYYVDQDRWFPYAIADDSLRIEYENGPTSMAVSLNGDTMIWSSPYGTTKYWIMPE
jgi:hypothetical protein